MEFGRDYKNKRRIAIIPDEEDAKPAEYLIPKGKHLSVQDGDRIEKGEYLLDGNPAPHDILAIKGVEELAFYLVDEIAISASSWRDFVSRFRQEGKSG